MGDDRIASEVEADLELLAARPAFARHGDPLKQQMRAELFGITDPDTHGDPPTPRDPPTPQCIGRFSVIRKLGAGGMGNVWLARDVPPLKREVAIKTVLDRRLSDAGVQQLRAEAETLGQLKHPNVVRVYDFGEHEHQPFVVMEYLERGTLSTLIGDQSVSRETLLQLCLQAGAGLAAAHRAGVIHGDFKPGNVLVGKDWRARVADFGLARFTPQYDDRETSPANGATPASVTAKYCNGTPAYMAPELFAGARPNERTDLFAYCVSLWEVLGGRRPYPPQTLLSAHARDCLPPPPRAEFGDKAWKRRLIERGLALDPTERWSSVQELLDAFDRRAGQRRLALGGTVVAMAVAGLVVAWPEGPPGECRGDSGVAVWGAEPREELEALFGASKLGYADAAGHTLLDALDRLQAKTDEVRSELCRDHYETGHLLPAGFDAGLACLRQADQRTRVLLQMLHETPDQALAHVDEIIEQLPTPASCLESVGDAESPSWTLLGVMDENQRAEARAALGLGRYREALTLSEAAARRAPKQSAARAEALLLAGAAARALDRPAEARTKTHESLRTAMHASAKDIEVRAALQLVDLDVFKFERLDDAQLWLDTASSALDAVGPSPDLTARYALASAAVDGLAGNTKSAEAKLRDAIAAAPTTSDELDAKLRLANLLAERAEGKDGEQAIALYTEILELNRARLGETHPAVGVIEFDIGATFHDLDRWAEAREHLVLALAHREPELGPESVHIAAILTMLASAETELGNAAHAIELAERAWSIQVALPRTYPDRGKALIVLGYARSEQEDFAGALESHRLMLTELDLGPTDIAANRQTQAWLHARLGHWEAARTQATAALLTTDEQIWRRAQFTLAEVEFRTGNAAAALRMIEHLRAQAPLEPPDIDLDAELVWLAALAGADAAAANDAWVVRAHLTSPQVAELVDKFSLNTE